MFLKSTLLGIRSYITIYMYESQDNLFVEFKDSGAHWSGSMRYKPTRITQQPCVDLEVPDLKPL